MKGQTDPFNLAAEVAAINNAAAPRALVRPDRRSHCCAWCEQSRTGPSGGRTASRWCAAQGVGSADRFLKVGMIAPASGSRFQRMWPGPYRWGGRPTTIVGPRGDPVGFDPHTGYFGNSAGVDADAAEEVYFKYVKPPDGARQWNEVQIDHPLTHDAEHFARTHLGQLPRVVLSREVSTWALTGQRFQQDLAVYGGRSAAWERLVVSCTGCSCPVPLEASSYSRSGRGETADSLGADCGCRAHRGCHLRRHPLPGSRGAVHRRSRRDRTCGPIPVVSHDVDCMIAAVAWPRADVSGAPLPAR